jgi:hypothetical protein
MHVTPFTLEVPDVALDDLYCRVLLSEISSLSSGTKKAPRSCHGSEGYPLVVRQAP